MYKRVANVQEKLCEKEQCEIQDWCLELDRCLHSNSVFSSLCFLNRVPLAPGAVTLWLLICSVGTIFNAFIDISCTLQLSMWWDFGFLMNLGVNYRLKALWSNMQGEWERNSQATWWGTFEWVARPSMAGNSYLLDTNNILFWEINLEFMLFFIIFLI